MNFTNITPATLTSPLVHSSGLEAIKNYCSATDTFILNGIIIVFTVLYVSRILLPKAIEGYASTPLGHIFVPLIERSEDMLESIAVIFMAGIVVISFGKGVSTGYYIWAGIMVVLSMIVILTTYFNNKKKGKEDDFSLKDVVKHVSDKFNAIDTDSKEIEQK